jgi:hypothetical protein
MTMKCLYAIPEQQAAEASALCKKYAAALEALSSDAVALADDLRSFAESLGAPALKVDEEDWRVAQHGLEAQGESALSGDIYWPNDTARRAQVALSAATGSESPAWALASWLDTQVRRDRAVVLLTC